MPEPIELLQPPPRELRDAGFKRVLAQADEMHVLILLGTGVVDIET